MRDPFQIDGEDDDKLFEIIEKNPFNGDDLKAFEKDAKQQLQSEAHGISTGQDAKDARQRLWTLHISAKKIRSSVTGAVLGLALGSATIENEDPIVRYVIPAGLLSVAVRLVDMAQFNSRARRASPEFFDYTKFRE